MWRGLTPAIESGVSGEFGWQCSAVFLFGFMVFLHVALGWNSLSSHSRFSNLRIIGRSYGRAAGLPAGFLRGLVRDLSGLISFHFISFI